MVRSTQPPRRIAVGRYNLTGRAGIATAVVVLCLVALATPVQRLSAQRAELNAIRGQIEQHQAEIADLEKRQARLRDPAYVARLARERLHFVLPGEVGYVVLDPGEEVAAGAPAPQGAVLARGPWWAQLWQSAREADAMTREPKPTDQKPPTTPEVDDDAAR